MTQLRKPQHERYAQLVAAGVSLMGAYEAAGYTPARGNPNRLARKPMVAARIKELESDISPVDASSIAFVRAKLIVIADEINQAGSNRTTFSRAANDLRRLSRALDVLGGVDLAAAIGTLDGLRNNGDGDLPTGIEIIDTKKGTESTL
jgi:hypothetical protein